MKRHRVEKERLVLDVDTGMSEAPAPEGGVCCSRVAGTPSPLVMSLRFTALGAGVFTAWTGMVREKKFRHLACWLAGWALFLSWPRRLICTRCDSYGELCRSYYLGKYTSLLFPRAEGGEVGPLGFTLEVVALSTVFWIPVLALRENRKLLLRYLFAMQLVLAGQFLHACRRCAAEAAEEWKKACPANRAWRAMGGVLR